MNNKIPVGFDVLFEGEYWKITNNDIIYELLPWYSTVNNGMKRAVPLDTTFDKVYTHGLLHCLLKIAKMKTVGLIES